MLLNEIEKKLPVVTIITVVKNGKDFIDETIKSVFLQDYQNIQYIVIDGCSSDGTLDILKANKQKIDILISENDDGIYSAMNKGINLSEGDLIGFLNASDILFPGVISKLANAYNIKNFDYSFGAIHIESKKNRLYHISSPIKDIPESSGQYIGMPSPHLSIYMKASFLRSLDMFDTQFSVSADYDLLLRSMKKSKNVWHFEDPVGAFRLGGVSGSYRTFVENYFVMKKNNFKWHVRTIVTARSISGLFLKSIFSQKTIDFFKHYLQKN
jgi:glycosyltransferase involved in cell wall biosynthesis